MGLDGFEALFYLLYIMDPKDFFNGYLMLYHMGSSPKKGSLFRSPLEYGTPINKEHPKRDPSLENYPYRRELEGMVSRTCGPWALYPKS